METAQTYRSSEEIAEVPLTILFSDVCGSTDLVERLGDRAAYRLIRAHHALVREKLAEHDGREIELRGDGALAVFECPADGLRCALEIQAAGTLRVRIGLHSGNAIPDGAKYFGRSVILASRLSDAALPDEVLVSEDVHEIEQGTDRFEFGAPRLCSLKGFAKRQRAFPVTKKSPPKGEEADRIAPGWVRLRKTGSSCFRLC